MSHHFPLCVPIPQLWKHKLLYVYGKQHTRADDKGFLALKNVATLSAINR